MGAAQSAGGAGGVAAAGGGAGGGADGGDVHLAVLAWAVPDAAERYARDRAGVGGDGEDDTVDRLRRAAQAAVSAAVMSADAATWANAALEIAAREDFDQAAPSPEFGVRLMEAQPALHTLHYAFTRFRGAKEAAFWMIFRHTVRQQLPQALAREGITAHNGTPVKSARGVTGTGAADGGGANAGGGEASNAADARAGVDASGAAAEAPSGAREPNAPNAGVIFATFLPSPEMALDAAGALDVAVVVSGDGFVVVPLGGDGAPTAGDVAAAAKDGGAGAAGALAGALEFSIYSVLNFAIAEQRFIFQASRKEDKEMRVYTLAARDALGTRLLDSAVRGAIEMKMRELGSTPGGQPQPGGAGADDAQVAAAGAGAPTGAAADFDKFSQSAWCTTQ